jgi:uncharacterized coiled-coil protein SlyX
MDNTRLSREIWRTPAVGQSHAQSPNFGRNPRGGPRFAGKSSKSRYGGPANVALRGVPGRTRLRLLSAIRVRHSAQGAAQVAEDESAKEDLEERVMELELRTEFQKAETKELDEVLREYAERVERLERELRELRAQLTAMAPTTTIGEAANLKS